MYKTIKIDGQEIKFSTSLSWAFIYKAQFGHDPLTMFVPILKSVLKALILLPDGFHDLDKDKLKEMSDEGSIDEYDLDDILNVLYDIETIEIFNLIWAFAKNADDEIPEPMKWYGQFSNFPLDIVIKDLAPAVIQSVVSTKKYKALMGAVGADTKAQKSQLKTSLAED